MDLSTVIGTLKNVKNAKVEDSEHIVVPCPFCGDSNKHDDGAHCVIWIRQSAPITYHCWICEEIGLVDNSFLLSLSITDRQVSTIVHRHLAECRSGKKVTGIVYNKDPHKLEIPAIKPRSVYNARKLAYMQKRIGIPFTYESMEYLRVIFSLKDFLKLNNLLVNPKYAWCLDHIEKNCVGFLSLTKDYIIFRSIEDDPKIRYLNYNIFTGLNMQQKLYTIPMRVDPMAEDVTFHISEGIMDILSVFFNVNDANTDNQIYTAVCGSGYKRVIEYFIKRGFLCNLHINIYSDNDKKPWFYNQIKYYKPWIKTIRLFYNKYPNLKDFGVPKEYILKKETVFK